MKQFLAAANKIDSLLHPLQESEEPALMDDARGAVVSLFQKGLSSVTSDHTPFELGEALVAGAYVCEDENALAEHDIAVQVLLYLEQVTAGARALVQERVGGDADSRPDMNPVDHAVYYYNAHGKFPANADRKTVVGAMKKLAALPKK